MEELPKEFRPPPTSLPKEQKKKDHREGDHLTKFHSKLFKKEQANLPATTEQTEKTLNKIKKPFDEKPQLSEQAKIQAEMEKLKFMEAMDDPEIKKTIMETNPFKNDPFPTEVEILADISALGLEKKQFQELLKGAHFRVADNGALYNRWRNLPGDDVRTGKPVDRISSHPHDKNTEQYGVNGKWINHILFGVITVDGIKHTFFQLEKTPFSKEATIREKSLHTRDAIEYVTTQRNVGPFGTSNHKDNNPIIIRQ